MRLDVLVSLMSAMQSVNNFDKRFVTMVTLGSERANETSGTDQSG